MNLDKKQWTMLIAGVVALFLVYWLFFRKKKTTESGYDDAVMIMGDSSYDPAFPELGGAESNYRRGAVPQGFVMRQAAGKCPCDSTQTGTCFKGPDNILECAKSISVPTTPPSGARAVATGGVKSPKVKCLESGGTWGQCWNDTTKTWYPCCNNNL